MMFENICWRVCQKPFHFFQLRVTSRILKSRRSAEQDCGYMIGPLAWRRAINDWLLQQLLSLLDQWASTLKKFGLDPMMGVILEGDLIHCCVYNIMLPQNQEQEQQSLPNIEDYFKQIPFGCRIIYLSLIILWVIDLMSGFPAEQLIADEQKIFDNYQIWRLFSASFVQISLLYLTINIISLHTVLPKLELRMNTLWILLNYFFMGALIQTLSAALSFVIPFKFGAGSACGIWFNFMFKYCYFNQANKIKFCCFKWMVPKIVYPFLMFLVITVLDFFQQIKIDILIGILLAFIECRFFAGNLFRCANNCGCFRLGQFGSWVEASAARNWHEGPYAALEEDLGRLQDTSDDENQSAFKNINGVRLSDA